MSDYNVKSLVILIWSMSVMGTTAYAVFWLGNSGWWFVLAIMLLLSGGNSERNNKKEK